MRQAWYLGGGLKPDELLALSMQDRQDYLDALDWWIDQVNEQQGSDRHARREGM